MTTRELIPSMNGGTRIFAISREFLPYTVLLVQIVQCFRNEYPDSGLSARTVIHTHEICVARQEAAEVGVIQRP